MYQTWNGSLWTNQYLFSYTYDENDRELSFLWKSGEADTTWVNYRLDEMSYDGNMKTSVVNLWSDGGWNPFARWVYYYNELDQNIDGFAQLWKDGAWADNDKYVFTYDTNHNLLNYQILTYDNGVWLYHYQWIYTYDSTNDRIHSLYQHWNDNLWEDYWQYFEAYNLNHNKILSDRKIWSGNSWRKTERYIYTYSNDNFQNSGSHVQWNDTGTKIISGDSTHYYPMLNFGIHEEPGSGSEITIYPNPGDGHYSIRCNSPFNSVEVFDISGRSVYFNNKKDGAKSMNLNLTGLVKGTYFIRIYFSTGQLTRKIIIK